MPTWERGKLGDYNDRIVTVNDVFPKSTARAQKLLPWEAYNTNLGVFEPFASDGGSHFDEKQSINGRLFVFDSNGNVRFDSVAKYTYDAWNRIVKIESGTTSLTAEMLHYDALGRFIQYENAAAGSQYALYYSSDGRELERRFVDQSEITNHVTQYVPSLAGSNLHVLQHEEWESHNCQNQTDGIHTRDFYLLQDKDGNVTSVIGAQQDPGTAPVVYRCRFVWEAYGIPHPLNSEWQAVSNPSESWGLVDHGFHGWFSRDFVSNWMSHGREYNTYIQQWMQVDPSAPINALGRQDFMRNNPVLPGVGSRDYDPQMGEKSTLERISSQAFDLVQAAGLMGNPAAIGISGWGTRYSNGDGAWSSISGGAADAVGVTAMAQAITDLDPRTGRFLDQPTWQRVLLGVTGVLQMAGTSFVGARIIGDIGPELATYARLAYRSARSGFNKFGNFIHSLESFDPLGQILAPGVIGRNPNFGRHVVRSIDLSHDLGVQLGRKFVMEESGLGLRETGWVNPIERGKFGQGFDDVLADAEGGLWIVEYKGGSGKLEPGQMGEMWVRQVIDRMIEEAPNHPWTQRLVDAWTAGELRGITVSSPNSNALTSVVKVRAYNAGM